MARINEEDYVAPTPSRSAAEVSAAAEAESLRAARTGLSNAMTNAGIPTKVAPVAPADIKSGAFLSTPTTTPKAGTGAKTDVTATTDIPAMNNRSKTPTENPGDGYRWQWVSMSKTKNQYGGEWRRYPIEGYNAGGGNAPIGTPPAFVFNKTTGKWEQPPKPTDKGTWVWDNIKGWVDSTLNPGASGLATGSDRTLAKDTFKNTLALFFGASEMSQAWVDGVYKSVASFYNTGSTIDESLNLALQDIRNNPDLKPFTDRFAGVYALQDRLAKGEAIEVPTIAEFFKSESAMGDVLRGVGLGELATQKFLGDVLGRGKSVLEVTNLINETFNAIDNAPDALKKDLQTYFPGVDRTSLAKALLTGSEGWQELSKKVRMVSSLSAAKSQGVTVSEATAQDIANMGYDYSQSLSGFQQVKELERGQFLGGISGIKFGQEEAIGAAFKQDAKALADIERIKKIEAARFSGSSGRLASRDRGVGIF